MTKKIIAQFKSDETVLTITFSKNKFQLINQTNAHIPKLEIIGEFDTYYAALEELATCLHFEATNKNED